MATPNRQHERPLKVAVAEDADLSIPQRILDFRCDITGCDNTAEWLCPGGIITCEVHKP